MVDKENIQNIYPLSPMQEGMLFHALADGQGVYLLQSRLEVIGVLDPVAFQKAWELLVARHDVFRTLFAATGAEQPLQIVLHTAELKMTRENLSTESPAEQEAKIEAFCRQDQATLFDLKKPPLLRLHLFTLAADRHLLIFTVHHIVMDGWCQGVLQEELLAAYYAFCEGGQPTLPSPVPYASFIKKITGQDEAVGLDFWRETLAEYQPTALFHWQDSQDEFSFACFESSLGAAVSTALTRTAADLGTTLHVLFQALWGLAAARFSGQDDLVFGTVVSGRPAEIPGSERIIGLCINTVPVRVKLRAEDTFADLVRRLTGQLGASMPWQQLPLVEISALVDSGAKLFDHLTVFENYPVADDHPLTEGRIRIQPTGDLYGFTNYDLVLVVDPGEELVVRFKFNSLAVCEEQVKLLRDSLLLVAAAVAERADLPLADVPILPAAEESRLLQKFCEGEELSLAEDTVVALFEAQVEKTPDRTAIVASDASLTYAELAARSNLIANRIIATKKAGRDECVGVVLDRDSWMHATLLGVMKSGAAYVPIDPAYPDERIAFLLDDCNCRLVLSNGIHEERLRGVTAVTAVTVLDITKVTSEDNDSRPSNSPEGKDLVYVIHTSGSTGKPKGVMVSHLALANFVRGFVKEVHGQYAQPLREAFVANYVFDASSRSFYPPLTRGDTVHVIDSEMRMDPQAFFDYLCAEKIQVLDGTPSLCAMLLEGEMAGQTPELLQIVCGGEGLSAGLVRRIQNSAFSKVKITNVYGPTETTVDSTLYHVDATTTERCPICPIGRPLANQRIYILDTRKKLLPVGAVGELFIGGRGVAEGYYDREELTREKFLPDPFRAGEIMYRTGDKARWLADGNIEFLGRMDQQVKIRGFRIEPGEIETVMSQHSEVSGCAVVVRKNGEDENELHAFYSGKTPPSVEAMRSSLGERLPAHMVPTRIVCLTRMPMTATGKIDRKSLPEIEPESSPSTTSRTLNSATEETLATLWQQVLGHDNFSGDDDFFVVGGHSLKAVRLVSRVNKAFAKPLPMTLAYLAPTIKKMAAVIDHYDATAASGLGEAVFVCNQDAKKTVFCLPPYGATSIVYTGLAQALPELRFVCINFNDAESFFADALEMLEEYSASEPPVLLGYSGGGNLAFELACRWEAQGKKIARLVLLDSYRRLSAGEVSEDVLRKEVAEIMAEPFLRSCLSTVQMRSQLAESALAYAKYISTYQEGERVISAAIHLLSSQDEKPDPSADRYGSLRSRAAWAEATAGEFANYAGFGGHDEMLWGEELTKNAAVLRNILCCGVLAGQVDSGERG